MTSLLFLLWKVSDSWITGPSLHLWQGCLNESGNYFLMCSSEILLFASPNDLTEAVSHRDVAHVTSDSAMMNGCRKLATPPHPLCMPSQRYIWHDCHAYNGGCMPGSKSHCEIWSCHEMTRQHLENASEQRNEVMLPVCLFSLTKKSPFYAPKCFLDSWLPPPVLGNL